MDTAVASAVSHLLFALGGAFLGYAAARLRSRPRKTRLSAMERMLRGMDSE